MNDVNEVVNKSIADDRIERVIEALSLVSLGDLDKLEVALPPVTPPDAFSGIETMVNTLIRDLAEVLKANDAYLEELERAARDAEEKLKTIERQQIAIQDLSTPIIEIWDDVLTLPIVGVVDTRRSVEMTERLLYHIVESRARCVIIDITGVDIVDTMTADHFIKMIKAAGMLGAYCVVSGINPDVAQTLSRIGVELEGIPTLRNLKDALKHCFGHLAGAGVQPRRDGGSELKRSEPR